MDFNEVFSPIVKHSSIRVMLAMVAMFDLKLKQLDVKTTFLHGELDEQIYMQQLEDFMILEKISCVLVEKVFVWIEVVSKVVVQEV